MRVYIDTEFIDNGRTIELISIALVTERGSYYAVSSEFDASKAAADEWLTVNVIAKLPNFPRKTRLQIRDEISGFLKGEVPEWLGYYASYDFVALCQLWGRMLDLPDGWPYYIHDLKIEARRRGFALRRRYDPSAHDALADAEWMMSQHNEMLA